MPIMTRIGERGIDIHTTILNRVRIVSLYYLSSCEDKEAPNRHVPDFIHTATLLYLYFPEIQ